MEQPITLKIKLKHATGLGRVKCWGKMAVYAVISVSNDDQNGRPYAESPVDRIGDTKPTWNFTPEDPLTVTETELRGDSLTLRFKLLCQRYYGNVDVGSAEISVKSLLNDQSAAADDGWRPTSIPVIKPRGGRQGLLSFSYKFNRGTIQPPSSSSAPSSSSSNPLPPPPPSRGVDWTKILTGMTSATENISVCIINGFIKIGERIFVT